MAQTIMIFDFGTNEEAAQQARHKIEGWKQGFRLGDKMTVKFEREDAGETGGKENGEHTAEASAEEKKPAKNQKGKKASSRRSQEAEEGGEAQGAKEDAAGHVRVLVRLGFSDHEKLSQQRWLDRIPAEEPFKSVKGETIRQNDPAFAKSVELFESLD
jgi:hypothetical protein